MMFKFLSKWKGVLGLSWQWQREHSGIAGGGWKDRRNTKIYSVTKKPFSYTVLSVTVPGMDDLKTPHHFVQ